MKDIFTGPARVKSTDTMNSTWKDLNYRFRDLRISDNQDTVTTASSLAPCGRSRDKMHQKKRTAAGDIKNEQSWQVDDLRYALQNAPSGEKKSNSRLLMEMDVLSRRIATIEAQSRSRNCPASLRRYGAFTERIGEHHDSEGKCGQATKGEDTTVGWEEAVLR